MQNRLIKIALIGKTNAGKSTLVNSMVGEIVSITNKKINTTQELTIGIANKDETQIILYDTPGSNLLKTNNINQKKLKTAIWESIENVDYILYVVDVLKYDFEIIYSDLKKFYQVNKFIIVIFNKIDLIDNKILLPYIKALNNLNFIDSFFNISAKYKRGIDQLFNYLKSKSFKKKWLYNNNEVSNKDDIFISNECTRNAILKYLHQEIPYNLIVRNIFIKILKNKHIKIKQSIDLKNLRYKPIILGKNGKTIKKIRESSQNEIANIMKSKVHLYIQINKLND